jgi:hypothetical protein
MQTDQNNQSPMSLTIIDETDQIIADCNDVSFEDANSTDTNPPSSTPASHTNNDTTMEIDEQNFQKVKP